MEEYGISSFVYYRRPAFDLNKFDHFIAKKWPASVIRAKGICYFSNNSRMSMMFEQAGVQKKLTECGLWYATAPEEELIELMREEPGLMRDWDLVYGSFDGRYRCHRLRRNGSEGVLCGSSFFRR